MIEVTPYALAVNLPYAIAFTCVAAEVAWLARRAGPARTRILRSAATATSMAAGALVVGVAYTAVFRALWEVVATQRWEAAATLLARPPGDRRRRRLRRAGICRAGSTT